MRLNRRRLETCPFPTLQTRRKTQFVPHLIVHQSRACRRVRGQNALARGVDFKLDQRIVNTLHAVTQREVGVFGGVMRCLAGFGNALMRWTLEHRCVGCASLGPRCGRP